MATAGRLLALVSRQRIHSFLAIFPRIVPTLLVLSTPPPLIENLAMIPNAQCTSSTLRQGAEHDRTNLEIHPFSVSADHLDMPRMTRRLIELGQQASTLAFNSAR
jgi:hypothetical protein